MHGREFVDHLLSLEDIDGNTPLLLAVEGGSTEITKILLQFGVDVDHSNRNRTHALHLAAKIGSLEIVKLLLKVK